MKEPSLEKQLEYVMFKDRLGRSDEFMEFLDKKLYKVKERIKEEVNPLDKNWLNGYLACINQSREKYTNIKFKESKNEQS